MKVAEATADRLIIKETPWLTAAILALMLLGVGLVAMSKGQTLNAPAAIGLAAMAAAIAGVLVFGVRFVTVVFSRIAGRIEIESLSLSGTRRAAFSMTHFRHARVDCSAFGDGDASRVVLVFCDAMLGELDPVARADIERKRALGLRRAAANEFPLTVYYAGGDGARAAAAAINRWAGAA